jgi:D-proline reductase (dithiol) PrdB
VASYDELPLRMRLFLRTYRWRSNELRAVAPIRRPLPEARIALVSSAGLVLAGDEPFDMRLRGGDPSYRIVPSEADPASLVDSHRSEAFDHAGMRDDPNLAFPLERMRELEAAGVIGSLAPRAVSVMGSITAPGRFVRETAPAIVELLRADRVDGALLVPV